MKAIPNLYFINEIFEIRIRQSDWQKIVATSRNFDITYTATVRLCTFQLMKKGLDRREIFEYKHYLRRKYMGLLVGMPREALHRHMLCLYGNDAIQIRIMAARYGLTVSDFVRIALELFLPSVTQDLLQGKLDIVRHGIKVYEYCKVEEKESFDMEFHTQHFTMIRFERQSYWPWRPFPFFGSG